MHLCQFCLLVTLAFVACCTTFASAEGLVHDKSLKTNSQRRLTDGSGRNLKGSIDEVADEERGSVLSVSSKKKASMLENHPQSWNDTEVAKLLNDSTIIEGWDATKLETEFYSITREMGILMAEDDKLTAEADRIDLACSKSAPKAIDLFSNEKLADPEAFEKHYEMCKRSRLQANAFRDNAEEIRQKTIKLNHVLYRMEDRMDMMPKEKPSLKARLQKKLKGRSTQ